MHAKSEERMLEKEGKMPEVGERRSESHKKLDREIAEIALYFSNCLTKTEF